MYRSEAFISVAIDPIGEIELVLGSVWLMVALPLENEFQQVQLIVEGSNVQQSEPSIILDATKV